MFFDFGWLWVIVVVCWLLLCGSMLVFCIFLYLMWSSSCIKCVMVVVLGSSGFWFWVMSGVSLLGLMMSMFWMGSLVVGSLGWCICVWIGVLSSCLFVSLFLSVSCGWLLMWSMCVGSWLLCVICLSVLVLCFCGSCVSMMVLFILLWSFVSVVSFLIVLLCGVIMLSVLLLVLFVLFLSLFSFVIVMVLFIVILSWSIFFLLMSSSICCLSLLILVFLFFLSLVSYINWDFFLNLDDFLCIFNCDFWF